MNRPFDPFDEDPARPSRLQLDRFAAGELSGAERSAVQQWVAKNAYALQHLDDLRNAKKDVRKFDPMLLRARAGGIAGDRLAASGQETFPPGMLDGVNLAAQVRGTMDAELKAVQSAPTQTFDDDLHDDLDRSTQPFAEERVAEPHQDAAIADDEPESGTEPGAPRRAAKQAPPPSVAAAPATPTAANRPMWMFLAPIAALAAAVLVAVGVGLPGGGVGPGIRTRGAADLELRVLDGGAMRAWDGKPLAAGAVVGFAVAPGDHARVVVLSIDGTGLVSPWLPASGEGSSPIGTADAALVPLDASVTLDATPGAEVFVAAFDRSAADVMKAMRQEFEKGGTTAVAAWAEAAPDADAVVVEKR